MLRILFSRLARPRIGSPAAYSFNVASVHGSGGITVERGDKTITKSASFSRTGGMCRAARARLDQRLRLSALYDDSKSLNEGALTIPGYSMDGWYGRIFRGCGFFDRTSRSRSSTSASATTCSTRSDQDQGRRDQPDLRRADPTDPAVDAVQRRRRDAAARPRLRGAGGGVHHLPRLRRHRLARRPVVEDRRRQHRRRLCDADLGPRRVGPRSRRAVGGPLLQTLGETLDSFVEIGSATLAQPASGTLSGGEAQRTKMIRHLGSSLTDVTYVFDEPTIGLHPHDVERMNDLLLQLRDKGNTVLIVEHEPETIAIADHVVDLGPGRHGGRHRLLRGYRRRTAGERHHHRPPSRRPDRPQGDGSDAHGHAGDPRRDDEQPARSGCRHPAWAAGRGDRAWRARARAR